MLTYSVESEGLPLPPVGTESEPCSSAKLTPAAESSCPVHGPACPVTMTSGACIGAWATPRKRLEMMTDEKASQNKPFPNLETQLADSTLSTSLPPVFLVSQPAGPGSNEARKMTAGSGRKLSESFPKSGPLGRCSRILLESETWASPEYLLKWKLKGTICGCSVFQLAPSVRRRDGNDSGLFAATWPTVNKRDEKDAHGPIQHVRKDGKSRMDQNPHIVKATWPTPKQPQGSACRTEKNMGRLHRMDDVTPASGEVTSGCLALTEKFVVRLTTLSAWLMGYTAQYLAHWATASSRKSQPELSQQ